MRKEPTKTGFSITMGLMILTWIVTIWLFHSLTDPQTRSQTFGFTLVFICFLEFLAFGYFGFLFVPHSRKSVVWALYPTIGIVLGLYIVISLIIVVGDTFLSIFAHSPKAYFTTLAVESLIFLIVLGSILILNAYKKVEDTHVEKDKMELVNLSVSAQEIYQKFTTCKELLDIQIYRDVETDLRKLKERFSFCAPFGRPVAGVSDIEKEIRANLASLDRLITEIPVVSKERLDSIIKEIKNITLATLQAMERREKLLIK
ncbi:MAG: hypothetical protein QW279_03610 [Candidatus Jordarchaeaceae archaeon]